MFDGRVLDALVAEMEFFSNRGAWILQRLMRWLKPDSRLRSADFWTWLEVPVLAQQSFNDSIKQASILYSLVQALFNELVGLWREEKSSSSFDIMLTFGLRFPDAQKVAHHHIPLDNENIEDEAFQQIIVAAYHISSPV